MILWVFRILTAATEAGGLSREDAWIIFVPGTFMNGFSSILQTRDNGVSRPLACFRQALEQWSSRHGGISLFLQQRKYKALRPLLNINISQRRCNFHRSKCLYKMFEFYRCGRWMKVMWTIRCGCCQRDLLSRLEKIFIWSSGKIDSQTRYKGLVDLYRLERNFLSSEYSIQMLVCSLLKPIFMASWSRYINHRCIRSYIILNSKTRNKFVNNKMSSLILPCELFGFSRHLTFDVVCQ